MQRREFAAQRGTQFGIETGERFVEQQQARRRHQCPRQRDALLLATRELVGVPASQMPLDSAQSQSVFDALGALELRNVSGPDDEFEISAYGQMWPEGEVLKHKTDTTLVRRDRVSSGASHSTAIQPYLAGIRSL